jgi:hypothetical protein
VKHVSDTDELQLQVQIVTENDVLEVHPLPLEVPRSTSMPGRVSTVGEEALE